MIAIEAMGARLAVLLGTANETIGVSFVNFYFLKGLLPFDWLMFENLGVSLSRELISILSGKD